MPMCQKHNEDREFDMIDSGKKNMPEQDIPGLVDNTSAVVALTRPDTQLHLTKPSQADILTQFSPEQQTTIQYRQQLLAPIGSFIGKDFRMPIELNDPGGGWYWDFGENKVRVDPQDLLEKPIDYLRFVIAHEGGHRRISRMAEIPPEIWNQVGFSVLMNVIEDPRDNNFISEAYPRIKGQMDLAYRLDHDFEAKSKNEAKDKLGFQPKFLVAGYEYIRQWFNELNGQPGMFGEDLPTDVKAVIENTLEAARDSWLHFPSRQEADSGEDVIKRYAQYSYEVNRDKIWPEFKKLVDADMESQEMQELLKDPQQSQGEGEDSSQNLPGQLSPEQQKELGDAVKQAQEKAAENGSSSPIVDLDSLSEGLKQKIKEFIDAQPQDVKDKLAEAARKKLEEFEDALNQEMKGKLTETPNKEEQVTQQATLKPTEQENEQESQPAPLHTQDELEEFRDLIERALHEDKNVYEKMRREVLPIIDELENDLRELFVARRANKWQGGFRSGKRVDIKKRMQERAKGVSAIESKAWQKRELPQEKDYAITLLVDLSGSMRGQKIKETFKGAIVLAEVLNRLSISTEILGFNDKLYEYQPFGIDMSNTVRDHMGGMLKEVTSEGAAYNDDGWALEQASERLAKQKASEKFLFVMSDGLPVPSPAHSGSKFELGKVIQTVMQQTDQKLIGLGIGKGTEHVASYYPNSIADINVKDMPGKLASVIREVIANYDTF